MLTIARLETFSNEFVCFVRVTAQDGSFGWGQCAPYNADITAAIFHRQIAPWALGWPVAEAAELGTHILTMEHKYPGSYLQRALAGLDTALWDLRGRVAEQPVAVLIGGRPGRVRLYASSMRRDIQPDLEAERLARLCGEQGFTAAKWRIGAECGADRDQWEGRTEVIIPTVAARLGQGIDMLVDANSGFSLPRAIEVGRRLEDNGVAHYEEPVAWWDIDATRAVTEALEIDVTGGEQDCDMAQWQRIVAAPAVDVVQPDILYLGGLTRTLDVARMAAHVGLPCTPHAANLSLVTIATAHLLRAVPNAGKYLEFSIEGDDYYPWQRGLFEGDPFRVTDGQIEVTDAPGWGVEPAAAWLAQAGHRETSTEGYAPSAYNRLYHGQS
ncbi:L-alanine-DL-glutamate epimerase-like enolase superfamily enzyme [Gemmobacter caeni]|uniref:L-alanine-DL-glutamate epimerase-like enolase superfamily enzyme n=1 Tax=Gemmobacter caeni TaxID=589035 RepID=A0A2T6AP45_9RHOB|nr:mandelate racemase/muconate lactonizing enzyme family protein [Gemmobacter caeni]PTX45591.1 L-alanine-DL-glutamate epimerase-like enolase superfamily enzyme [Gemmobacter caeni]TWI93739.1 L-alanine-DL-glutamate epimerase-like enolase superfamily enzyme [Gemmobacter caeni]